MAKIRGIKPETWTDESFVSVSPMARLLFIGMWNFACDNGHLDDSATQLKMRVLPADECNATSLLAELVDAGLVERLNGFLKLPNLAQHQKVDKRFVTRCEHCEQDEDLWHPLSLHGENTSSTRSGHSVVTSGSLGDGDLISDGDLKKNSLSDPIGSDGVLIPSDWRPNQKHIDLANSLHLDVKVQYQNFRRSAVEKHRRLKNWNTGFTNWLRKQAEFAQQRGGVQRKPSGPDARAAATLALADGLKEIES